MKRILKFTTIAAITLASCATVKVPKYVPMDKVYELKLGMSMDDVAKLFEQKYYDLAGLDKDGNTLVIYKYRVDVRKVSPALILPTNGTVTTGKFDNLLLKFDSSKKLVEVKGAFLSEIINSNKEKIK